MKDNLSNKEKRIIVLFGLVIGITLMALIAIIFCETKGYVSGTTLSEREELTTEEYIEQWASDYEAIEVEGFQYQNAKKSTESKKTTSSKKTTEQKNEQADTDEYIIADSDSRTLTEKDLKGLSADELFKARNEIYARHGRKFVDQELQDYFDEKSWYERIYEPDEFPENALSTVEKNNAKLILDYEKKKGYE